MLLPTLSFHNVQEKGKLVLAAKAEQQRRAKAEAELRRVQARIGAFGGWPSVGSRLTLPSPPADPLLLLTHPQLNWVLPQEQLAFRLGEVKHLKAALRERDGQLADAADRLREYELAEGGERTAAEEVCQAQGGC